MTIRCAGAGIALAPRMRLALSLVLLAACVDTEPLVLAQLADRHLTVAGTRTKR